MIRALFLLIAVPYMLTGQSTEYQSLIIPKEYKQNANSCIRESSTKIVVKDNDKIIVEHHRVVTLFNENGKSAAGMSLFYDDNVKVKDLEVLVYDAMGKEIKKIRKKEFRDVSASGESTMYSDSRFYVLDYEPREYPVSLELTYKTKNSNTAFIRPWQPISHHYQSVMSSKYQIIDEEGVGLRYKKSHFDFSDMVSFTKNDKGIICTAKDLKAVKKEDYSPGLEKFTPHLKVSLSNFELEGVEGKARTWQELGKWQYDHLIHGRDEISEHTKDKIIELTKGIEDPVERARKVYEYVQDKTRYISIQVGIGGWQPVEASEVDELEYGDCKGLTNYTKALLNIADVPANYAVVNSGRTKEDIDPDFPSMQGNHVILNLPQQGQEDIWLECTSQRSPFGFIGEFTDDRYVLLVKENGGEIDKTTAYYNKENYQQIDATLELNIDGDLFADMSIASEGTQFSNKYFLQNRSERDVLKFYRNYYDHFKNIEILDFDFERNDEEVVFRENLKIHAKKYARTFGPRMMFIPNSLNQTFSVPDHYKERIAPFEISRGYFDKDKLIYNIPEDMKIESMPEKIVLESKFGAYLADFEKISPDQIRYTREMLVKKGRHQKADYSSFRDFMDQIKAKDQSKIILIKKS